MPPGLIHTVRHEARHAWTEWRAAVELGRKGRLIDRWLEKLRSDPPDALLGANINANDGIRHHLLGIARNSSLAVQLAPPDDLLAQLPAHEIYTTFRQKFLDYRPLGIKAVHSHVFPYFVEWCAHHRESGVRWVHTYHAPYVPDPPGSALPEWQNAINDAGANIARNAHVRISVSKWQQKYLQRQSGIDTIYLPNGVDVTLCDAANPEDFKKKFGSQPFVLYVGRDDPVKNPADFIRLAQSLPRFQFVMIGNGLSADALLRTANVDTPANVTFMGEMQRPDVQSAIAACSLLVVTSKREGLPTVVLEALAHRKPLVVPNDPGCVEAIGGGEFGLVYEHGDIADLTEKTGKALAQSYGGEGGRAMVLSEYDWRVVAPQLDAIYSGAAN